MFKFLVFLPVVTAYYSVKYIADPTLHPRVLLNDNQPSTFTSPPNAEHVADIFARLSGNSPLLREDNVEMPSIDILKQSEEPSILEIYGGTIPDGYAVDVISAGDFEEDQRGPPMHKVLEILHRNDMNPNSAKFEGKKSNQKAIKDWLREQKGPVVLLHHDMPSKNPLVMKRASQARVLMDDDDSAPISLFEISEYQICLWTGVILFFIFLTAICSVCNMDVIPDSLLYAKFQATRANKND